MKPKRPAPVTAGELMAELMKDPGYVAHLEELEQQKQFAREEYITAAAPVLSELRAMGLQVESVGDLRYERRSNYRAAIPVLIRWLPRMSERHVKEDIIRTLSVPWAKPDAIPILLEEFHRLPKSENEKLKWVIGNALEVLADDSNFDEILPLIEDEENGLARSMLVVSLGNMTNPRVPPLLMRLLDDPELAPYAIIALGKLKTKEAKPKIEPFLKHPIALVRQQARKALDKIGDQ